MKLFLQSFDLYDRTLHLYLVGHFNPLKRLLERQANAKAFDQNQQNDLYGMNVWIVYVAGGNSHKRLVKTLEKSHLPFDSHVFEFLESFEGNFLIITLQ